MTASDTPVKMLTLLFVLIGTTVATDCSALGFTDALLCSTCVEMASFVTDDAVTNECFACCSEDRNADSRQFSRVSLVVDTARLQFYPSIESFVNKHAFKFTDRLRIVNRQFWRPVLELYDHSDILVESLAVDNWQPHQLVQFLEERVTRPRTDTH